MHFFLYEKYRTIFIMFKEIHYKNLSFKPFQIKKQSMYKNSFLSVFSSLFNVKLLSMNLFSLQDKYFLHSNKLLRFFPRYNLVLYIYMAYLW